MEVLTASVRGAEALAVFGFEEEAEMYLRLRGLEVGWWVRETTRGELVSILYGPCAHVGRVTLDPPPEVCRRMFALFDGVDRRRFLQTLTQAQHLPAHGTDHTPDYAMHDLSALERASEAHERGPGPA